MADLSNIQISLGDNVKTAYRLYVHKQGWGYQQLWNDLIIGIMRLLAHLIIGRYK